VSVNVVMNERASWGNRHTGLTRQSVYLAHCVCEGWRVRTQVPRTFTRCNDHVTQAWQWQRRMTTKVTTSVPYGQRRILAIGYLSRTSRGQIHIQYFRKLAAASVEHSSHLIRSTGSLELQLYSAPRLDTTSTTSSSECTRDSVHMISE
jgi:hypothetical protein